MLYVKLICILLILYLFFCLFLLSYGRFRKNKNPFIIVDKVVDNIELHMQKNELQKKIDEYKNEIEEFKSMS